VTAITVAASPFMEGKKMYEQIKSAGNFLERVTAVHNFVTKHEALSIDKEDSALVLSTIDGFRKLFEEEMKQIVASGHDLSPEEADAAVALSAKLLKIVRHEKQLQVARREFDTMSSGVVN
jgi:hypothetical protein